MASVTLEYSDIALISDLANSRAVMPRVTAQTPALSFEQASVRWEGDKFPSVFRGEGQGISVPLAARYLAGEHEAMADLVYLFQTAHEAADGRLLLRLHTGLVYMPEDRIAVTVANVNRAPVAMSDNAWDVTFTATACEWDETA